MVDSHPPRILSGRARLALVLVVLAGILVLVAFSVRTYFEVDEVRLPDLVGMPVADATRVLREADLVPQTYSENVANAPANTVTKQSPPPGSVVRKGRAVSVGVNTPPEAARVPVLVGLTHQEAMQRLRDLNLEAADVSFAYSDRTAGLVIGQAPEAGSGLASTSGISLTVSRGPERQDVTIPDVTGQDVGDAVRALERLGFTRIETVASSVTFDRPGSVTGQLPEAGETISPTTPVTLLYSVSGSRVVRVPALDGMSVARAQIALRAANLAVGNVEYIQDDTLPPGIVQAAPSGYTVVGSPVSLVVNGTADGDDALALPRDDGADLLPGGPTTDSTTAEVPDRRSIPFTFDPASLGVRRLLDEDYHLRLVVDDREGERTILDRDVEAGGVVSTTVTVYGPNALLQTYINGVPFQAWRP